MSYTHIAAPSALDCIAAIVAAEGDLDLATERLFGYHNPQADRARLIATIADDPPAVGILKENLRTLAMLQAFQSVRAVGIAVDGTLQNQSPHDLIKLYTNLMGILATFTDDHKSTIEGNFSSLNLTADVVLNQFPKDVQDAIKVLLAPNDPTTPTTPQTHSHLNPTTHPATQVIEHQGRSLGDPPPNAARGDTN
jgi:hypothetical protein